MKPMRMAYATTKVSRRMEMPENIGMPIRFWDIPTVNGLTTPAAKPKHAASTDIPSPTSASHPKA